MLRGFWLAGVALVVWLAVGTGAARADAVAEQLNPAHTGVSAEGLGPPLRERWRRVFDPSVPISHEVRWPLVAGGRVFVTYQNREGGPGELYSLDPTTGATVWKQQVTGWLAGAAYGDGKVLVATREALYAFDAETGEPAWTRTTWPGRTGTGIDSGPVVADGVAYVGVLGAVYAVNVVSNTVAWTRETTSSYTQGIGVGADYVYVNIGAAVLALRRAGGTEAWRGPAPDGASFLPGDPAVAGGRVYVPSRYDGAVYDAASGALLRKRFWMDPVPAIDGQRAYVLSGVSAEQDAIVHAVDAASGATAWEFGGWDGVTSFPLVAGQYVYITGRRGDLYALDRSSGAVAWCMRTDTTNYGGDPHTLALGAGLMLLAVGGELVALESGGTPGCRFYETALPGYADPIDDWETSRTTEAAGGFVPNRGQLSGSVLFASDGGEDSLLVDESGPTLTMPGAEVTLRLRGGEPAESVQPEQRLSGVVNDYTGRDRGEWRTGLPRYGRIRLRRVGEGVDLVVRDGRQRRFAYDLVLAPGTDPEAVALEFRGAEAPALDRDGSLVLRTPGGTLRQPPPVAYQRVRGQPVAVPARFRLLAEGGIGFAVGDYDRSRTLVIDPTLEWSTYLGGGVDDEINAIDSDPAGNVYVAGRTLSRDLTPAGALDGFDERNSICEDFPPCFDAFAAKYALDGSLVHITYLAGRRDDSALAIDADGAGNAYVAGFTNSPNFPIRSAYQPDWRCGFVYGDAFVTKLSPSGAALEYSTYLGGCGSFGDVARGIAVDPQGRAVVAGETDAFDFPTTVGDRVCAEPTGFCRDAFVARLSASGSALEWSTYFGGDESDEIPYDVELDGQGRPVVVGETAAWGSKDFPATPGSYDPDPALGFTEVFAARLAGDGSAIQWATAFGGRDWDQGFDATLDGSGDVHIAGTTESRDFPTTAGAFDQVCNDVPDELSCTNHPDAFALELSADGSQLLASTYVGGAGYEEGLGIAVDAAGRSYIAGSSSSPYGFPLVDAFQATMVDNHRWCAARADCSDAFLVRLDRAKAQVEYGTFHGGLSHDQARGVALADGDAWIAGLTHSPNLATTADSWAGGNCSFLRDSLEFPSCSDAFIARIDEARPPAGSPPPSTDHGGPGGPGATSERSAMVEPSGGGTAETVPVPRIARALTIRVRGGRVVGRVRAGGAPRCARRVQVRLEKRGLKTWRLVARARTGTDRRFALPLPRTTRPLRVRLPSLTRTDAGTLVRCASVARRVRR